MALGVDLAKCDRGRDRGERRAVVGVLRECVPMKMRCFGQIVRGNEMRSCSGHR